MIAFAEFPKIPRYRREVAVTEKLDGTNAAVAWHALGDNTKEWSQDALDSVIAERMLIDQHGCEIGMHALLAQSRQRFITPASVKPKNDNYGFAQWVKDHQEELVKLGPGVHYGEWWGYGIQRGYGVPEKRFSLFNVNRWDNPSRPACCHVVPLMCYCGPDAIAHQVERLRTDGSLAAPGYMRPEGVIVWHSQSKQYYKILLENDDVPKSVVKGDA